jgi:hypothetical protein
MTFPRIFTFAAFAIVAGCSSPPEIDSYITFNIVRTVDFPVSNIASASIDTSVVSHASIDTMDYQRNESSAYLLHTSKVARIAIRSSDPGFTLDKLAYARVLIGSDTVGFGSGLFGIADTLAVTGVDITPFVRDTSFKATLQFKLGSAPQQPVTISTDMTIIHTALHTPLVQ